MRKEVTKPEKVCEGINHVVLDQCEWSLCTRVVETVVRQTSVNRKMTQTATHPRPQHPETHTVSNFNFEIVAKFLTKAVKQTWPETNSYAAYEKKSGHRRTNVPIQNTEHIQPIRGTRADTKEPTSGGWFSFWRRCCFGFSIFEIGTVYVASFEFFQNFLFTV